MGIDAYYEEAKEIAALYNEKTNLILISREDKTKIAEIKTRIKEEGSDDGCAYWEYRYNPSTEINEFVCLKPIKWINFSRVYTLVFGDGSSMEADVYFGQGFESVINQWFDFTGNFNK